jgi:hypothetical protein
MSAAPNRGDVYLRFDGLDDYIEVPSSDVFTISAAGGLTVSAWMRPDALNFDRAEGTGYVHWMGKGETNAQEWVFRMYNRDLTTETPPRPNRISFYVFNSSGGLGVGSYFQDAVTKGRWIHVVGVAGEAQVYIYKDGALRRCDTFRGPAKGGCAAHTDPATGEPLEIDPQPGNAPLRIGTRDKNSFFKGGIRMVRIWGRALAAEEIQKLFAEDTVPADGLVAEYRLDKSGGTKATDSTGKHDGVIFGARWATQS